MTVGLHRVEPILVISNDNNQKLLVVSNHSDGGIALEVQKLTNFLSLEYTRRFFNTDDQFYQSSVINKMTENTSAWLRWIKWSAFSNQGQLMNCKMYPEAFRVYGYSGSLIERHNSRLYILSLEYKIETLIFSWSGKLIRSVLLADIHWNDQSECDVSCEWICVINWV